MKRHFSPCRPARKILSGGFQAAIAILKSIHRRVATEESSCSHYVTLGLNANPTG